MRSLAILLPTVAYFVYFCLNNIFMVSAECPKKCRLIYRPICSIRFGNNTPNHCTFLNLCLLVMYICKTRQKWIRMSNEVCRFHVPDCDEIQTYFRNNSHLVTYDGVHDDEEDDED